MATWRSPRAGSVAKNTRKRAPAEFGDEPVAKERFARLRPTYRLARREQIGIVFEQSVRLDEPAQGCFVGRKSLAEFVRVRRLPGFLAKAVFLIGEVKDDRLLGFQVGISRSAARASTGSPRLHMLLIVERRPRLPPLTGGDGPNEDHCSGSWPHSGAILRSTR